MTTKPAKKPNMIGVKLSDAQLKELRKMAKRAKMKPSTFVRKAVFPQGE